ncbi:MAG: V-type ATP synthase subunit D [Methanomassiliicoccales archaeon]|nr:MAG: V-type ATP synthase subunit D [Methanomassiliicoccales archaeon]
MAEEIIEGINPTRMELLSVRKRKKLAMKGHKLLSEKRDALVVQFFDIIKDRNSLRNKADSDLRRSYSLLVEAQMIMGQEGVGDATGSIPALQDVPMRTVNIMGVHVPKVEYEAITPSAGEPLYGYIGTSAKLDEASDKFRRLLVDILKLAEVEGTIERLAVEIEKTKRRVNALEHIFIPRLKATEKYIEMQLQEREREDFFRRKRIKAIMEAAG